MSTTILAYLRSLREAPLELKYMYRGASRRRSSATRLPERNADDSRREPIVRAIAACAANGHPASTRRLALLMLVRAQFLAQRTKRLLERTDAAAAHMCALPSARRRTPPRCCAWRRRETGRVVRAERECECTHVEGVCNPIPGARARGVTQHVQHGAQWIERVVQGVCVLRVEMFNT